MSPLSPVHLAPLHFENEDLVPFSLFDDCAHDLGALKLGLANLDGVVTPDQEHLIEANFLTHFSLQAFEVEPGTLSHVVLLTTALNYGVQVIFSLVPPPGALAPFGKETSRAIEA